MDTLKTLLNVGLTILQWLLSLITGGVILISFVGGAWTAFLVALVAFLVVFPPIQRRWIEPKLPFLQPKAIKVAAAFILLIATLFVTPTPTLAKVCEAPEADKCNEHRDSLNVDQVDTAYVVVALSGREKGEDATLELNYTANEASVVYTNTQKLEAEGQDSVQFELLLNELPIGDYEVAIAIGETTVTQDFELTGNPPQLNDLALCGTSGGTLDGARCESNYSLYLEGAFDKLHLTAGPEYIRSEIPLEVSVNYIPEPGQAELLDTVEGTIRPDDTDLKIDIPLSSFEIGAYEITLSSPNPAFSTQTETITVWHDTDAIDARAEGTLSDSSTPLTGFKLCEQQLTEEELAQLEADAGDDEATDIDNSDRCATDDSTFPAGVQTLAADIDIGSDFARPEDDTVDLTFVWRYLEGPSGGIQELNVKTYPIEPDLGTFVYSLTGPDSGYPAGTYDVTVFLETNTARPIRREFVVE
ncbi:MAG: hypothetical protein ACFB0C_09035 [Leptolyngbyaceae cyanobacterium]